MRLHRSLLLTLVSLTAVHADAADRDRHKLRLGVTWTSSGGSFSTSEFTENFFFRRTDTTAGEGGSAIGVQAGYEFRPIRRLGVAIGAEHVTVDFGYVETIELEEFDFFSGEFIADTATGGADGELGITPVILGVHWYLATGGSAEFYLGPTVGYIYYDDLEQGAWIATFTDQNTNPVLGEPRAIPLENDRALGGVIGLDLDLGEGAGSFHIAVSYLDASVNPKDPAEDFTLEVDPFSVRAGVVFRF